MKEQDLSIFNSAFAIERATNSHCPNARSRTRYRAVVLLAWRTYHHRLTKVFHSVSPMRWICHIVPTTIAIINAFVSHPTPNSQVKTPSIISFQFFKAQWGRSGCKTLTLKVEVHLGHPRSLISWMASTPGTQCWNYSWTSRDNSHQWDQNQTMWHCSLHPDL